MTRSEWKTAKCIMDEAWDLVSKNDFPSIAHKVFRFSFEYRLKGYSWGPVIKWNELRQKFLITEGLNPNGKTIFTQNA